MQPVKAHNHPAHFLPHVIDKFVELVTVDGWSASVAARKVGWCQKTYRVAKANFLEVRKATRLHKKRLDDKQSKRWV